MIPPERKKKILLYALAELRRKAEPVLRANIDSVTRQEASTFIRDIQELEREVESGR